MPLLKHHPDAREALSPDRKHSREEPSGELSPTVLSMVSKCWSNPVPYRDRQRLVRRDRTEGRLSGDSCSEGPKLDMATHPVLLRRAVGTQWLGAGAEGVLCRSPAPSYLWLFCADTIRVSLLLS